MLTRVRAKLLRPCHQSGGVVSYPLVRVSWLVGGENVVGFAQPGVLNRVLWAMGALALSAGTLSAEPVRHYAQSLIGEPHYPPDFKHFDYANPDAPKGGSIRYFVQGTFDSVNEFTTQGNPAGAIFLIYDRLFERSYDETSEQYGLVAEWASYPDDWSSVTYHLREGAKFNDGTPVTPEDVVFSMEAIKKADPRQAFYYKNVKSGAVTGEREVTFTFDTPGNRELPHIVGELSVLPKHYWTAKGANGEVRDLSKSTLEIPVGSGPYRIKAVDPGRSITYERVKDYWAKELPYNAGQNNFDELKFVYFRDRTPAFEAFKGGELDIWREASASDWGTKYDFAALTKGLVKKELVPVKRVAHNQPFVFNLRRAKFQDIRVRRAFNLALNFEELNKKLFFGAYIRSQSFFDNSELKWSGLPQGRELEMLNEIKDGIPPEVFTTEYKSPVHTPQTHRALLAEAVKLLDAAGWTNKNGTLVNAAGEEFTVEFLLEADIYQRIVLPFTEDLKLLGIKATARVVDPSQYKEREDNRDFDIIIDNLSQSNSLGNEQRDYWGSAAADQPTSRNTAGIKSAAIDKLIDKIVFAKDRAELLDATHALDRVLLWSAYTIPLYHFPFERLAYWDIFGRPDRPPFYDPDFLRVWWIDPAKQAAVAAAKGK